MNLNLVQASNRSGEAVRASVTVLRTAGSSVITVDSLTNWPANFIATSGKMLTDNTIDPTSVLVFSGHTSGGTIVIDSIAPGYTDNGNSVADIVVIKPTTMHMDNLADFLGTSMNGDGSFKPTAVQTALQSLNILNWYPLTTNITAVTYNGQRSYDLTSSADLTSTLSPGMRLRTTRTVPAPNQSASLNGTTQYFSKTSPAGMTFTDDFVVSAWVKISSYAAQADIISRYNGTSGWQLYINTAGQIELVGRNGGSANFSRVVSYQSIPLNKWVHISAQLDMSTFTATTTTSYVMLDGVDVPASVSRSGTNPTALIQAGNLEVGSTNGGLEPFPGKIAQAAVFSAKVTQATMRGYMSQGLTGTETNLISAFSLSNSLADLNTTNANNLTANNAATTTNADSPFGGQAGGTISTTLDYGIIEKITASTITVQVPEGCTIPTSGGVASISYSPVKEPYGFPGQKYKWDLEVINIAGYAANTGTAVVSFKYLITVPIGAWNLGYNMNFIEVVGASGVINARIGLGLAAAANVNASDAWTTIGTAVNLVENYPRLETKSFVELSAQTPYYLNGNPVGTSFTNFGVAGVYGYIRAENAYL